MEWTPVLASGITSVAVASVPLVLLRAGVDDDMLTLSSITCVFVALGFGVLSIVMLFHKDSEEGGR